MLYRLILVVHIAAGGGALVASAAALWAIKGSTAHRWAGTAFIAAMILTSVGALALAALKPNAFLFALGVFSLYLSLAGREAVRPGWLGPWAIVAAFVMVAVGLAMVGAALSGETRRPLVLGVFGGIGLLAAVQDLYAYLGRSETPRQRLARHLARTLAASTAAWTAFAVVNLQALPPLIAWLGPTLSLTPVIAWWAWRVRTRAWRPSQS
jgi:uncharacterized membrane protein